MFNCDYCNELLREGQRVVTGQGVVCAHDTCHALAVKEGRAICRTEREIQKAFAAKLLAGMKSRLDFPDESPVLE